MKRKISYTIEVDKEDADILEKYIKKPRQLSSLLPKEIAARFLGPRLDGYHIDHIDDNWKNNRRKNLQYLSARDNMRKNSKARYYGVVFRKGSWSAKLRRNKKEIHIGSYLTELDAAYAIDNWLRSKGEEAVNFPNIFNTPKSRTYASRKGSAGFYGVTKSTHFYKKTNSYRYVVRVKGKYLGTFTTAVEAAKVRDKYVVENRLIDKSLLNFPEDYGL